MRPAGGAGIAQRDGLVVTLPAKPLEGEGRPGAVVQQPFEAGAILGLEAHGGMEREPAAVAPGGEVGDNVRDERTVADGGPQHPAGDPTLRGADRRCIRISGAADICVVDPHAAFRVCLEALKGQGKYTL